MLVQNTLLMPDTNQLSAEMSQTFWTRWPRQKFQRVHIFPVTNSPSLFGLAGWTQRFGDGGWHSPGAGRSPPAASPAGSSPRVRRPSRRRPGVCGLPRAVLAPAGGVSWSGQCHRAQESMGVRRSGMGYRVTRGENCSVMLMLHAVVGVN